ncbi:glycoside hydrolase family 88 protein [Actinotalea ferrariae]|uniref:glycoside hydrolase family 88 protein n=1 Tax=Actinotalea ferrariae TaxID=1386098 RepID=UPI001EBDD794|nr:glycoside hydrolase family 88 protein [Actinotalea ferrariae]MBX9244488.1 glycoside hydrolase family 88 protein [Actinotalea ferrariae]
MEPTAVRTDGTEAAVLRALLAMQRLSWEQGVATHAALDLGRDDLVAVMADDAVVRQDAQGRLAEVDGGGLVNCGALVEAVAVEAARTGRADLADGLARQLDWFERGCPRAADGTLFHPTGGEQMWTDSVYMLVPALFRLGRPELAMAQLAGHRARLRGAGGLYAARWDEPTSALVAPQHWGTGNGWVAAGLARAWREEAAAPHRGELARQALEVVEACLEHRRADGLFHDVVDDPTSFVEANLAQMLAYAVLTGVADGWLDASWAEVGRDLRRAAGRGVGDDGLVRPVAGSPHFDRTGRSAEAQAFFLLAAAADRRVGQA